MIVRDGRRNESANTPAPANVAGVYAINTISLVTQMDVAPVERRYLSPQEPTPAHNAPVAKGKYQRPLGDDEALWAALRRTRGNVTHAAELLGRERSGVRKSVLLRQRRGVVPPDVAWLLAHPQRRPTTPKGTHFRSPETRALISIRMREHFARKRAA